jgi:thiol-disulfide isomerase/thioredoxin
MSAMPGDVLALLVVLALTGAVALWWRSRQGRVSEAAGDAFARAEVGVPAGVPLLVEFTAPGCVPCSQAAEVLGAIAARRDDVAFATADVGEHLDLARAHGILRAPTTLLVDADDRVRARISGVPAPDDVEALLDGRVVSRV